MERKSRYFFGVGATLLILIIGFIFGKIETIRSTVAMQVKTENDQRGNDYGKLYDFINPLLDCGDLVNISNQTVDEIKSKVRRLIDEQKTYGVEEVAVYFRDLNNGPWVGVKEKEKFFPASLLKVPLMLSLLKQASGDPSILEKKFVWQGASRNNEYFKAGKELENNHTYSIDEALTYMIKYSDNNSSHVLSYAISTDTLLSSYQDLGVPLPSDSEYTISAKTYGSFFRILYNSTFLNKEYSEKALRLLSETQFDKGLVAGLPASIKVAHKFGERQVNSSVKQLHDCGIVYYPGKPYLLCVMTRGRDFDKLAAFIAQVSSNVYGVIDRGE